MQRVHDLEHRRIADRPGDVGCQVPEVRQLQRERLALGRLDADLGERRQGALDGEGMLAGVLAACAERLGRLGIQGLRRAPCGSARKHAREQVAAANPHERLGGCADQPVDGVRHRGRVAASETADDAAQIASGGQAPFEISRDDQL